LRNLDPDQDVGRSNAVLIITIFIIYCSVDNDQEREQGQDIVLDADKDLDQESTPCLDPEQDKYHDQDLALGQAQDQCMHPDNEYLDPDQDLYLDRSNAVLIITIFIIISL
jgi:hypothetical protein